MNRHRLLFDMSSLLWTALLVGKDKEHGKEYPNADPDKKPIHVNSAEFGFENFVNMIVSYFGKFKVAPRDVIMVWDGASSKLLRQSIDPGYKANRDHHPESYVQFDRLREMARDALLGLGALSAHQDGMEADDVLCFLSQNLRCKRTIISNDGDMPALVNELTDVYCTGTGLLSTVGTWERTNKYGPFPFHNITLYKALVGDSSDGIKGAVGFGPKSFVDLMVKYKYDGLDLMTDLIVEKQLHRLVDDGEVKELKCLQKVVDGAEGVYASWGCARMYPEKVNTNRSKLQVQAAMPQQWDSKRHDARLKQWYGATRVINADNYEAACQFAMGKLLESDHLALDIETSTPEESDEWLELRKRNAGGEEGGKLGVDVLGSELTGMGVTFGSNQQYSFYFSVDHVEEDGVRNVTSEQVRQFVELKPSSKMTVVHNASFEMSVLFQEWGEAWKDNGEHGMLPNICDTMIMKSYVNENSSRALKSCSKEILDYDQATYADVTQGRKMNQMTARETVAYGCDDTICTSALHNYLSFWMEIEDSWKVYTDVDVDPAYLNALRYVQGTPISLEKVLELEKADGAARDLAWVKVRDYLIKCGWQGSVCPQFTDAASFTPAAMKEAYQILTGKELKTQVRTPAKLVALMASDEEALVGGLFNAGIGGYPDPLNELLKDRFSGEPDFNTGSPKQLGKFLYETMGLPVRLRNPPTDLMRAKGIREGQPRTDDLSIQFALKFDAELVADGRDEILRALQTMKVMQTKQGLYYTPYRTVQHWKTGLVHSHVNQCATVTRRYSDADPNKQQLPKNPKLGEPARFREVFIPHTPTIIASELGTITRLDDNAVVVSMDFTGQELITIADRSQDPNMLACYVGDNKKDLHSITASRIIVMKSAADLWRMAGYEPLDPEDKDGKIARAFAEAAERWRNCTYEQFIAGINDPKHPDHKLLKDLRQLGKKTNFTTEYGAQAPKLAETLVIERSEAQQYIDAKLEAFARAEEWKKEVIARAHERGYSETLLGARRHLPDLQSSNKWDVMGAERQAVNFEIQGSCAEMTKKAEGRLWRAGVFFKYDARYIGPVHDELVSSCAVRHLKAYIKETHQLMTMPYGGMTVPIISSISFGRNYGEQIEVGDCYDEAKIDAALRSLGYSDKIMTLA